MLPSMVILSVFFENTCCQLQFLRSIVSPLHQLLSVIPARTHTHHTSYAVTSLAAYTSPTLPDLLTILGSFLAVLQWKLLRTSSPHRGPSSETAATGDDSAYINKKTDSIGNQCKYA